MSTINEEDVIPGEFYLIKEPATSHTEAQWTIAKYLNPAYGWVNRQGDYVCGDGGGGIAHPEAIISVENLEECLRVQEA